MNSIVPSLSIRTPEGISFQLLLAGIVPRFIAWTIDACGVVVLSSMIAKLLAIFTRIDSSLAGALGIMLYFGVSIGYGILFEWLWRGQTPGKRLLGLRVMDLHGLRLQFSQVVIRNLLRAVDMLPAFYFLGGLVAFFNRNCQRLGDIGANTIVTRIRKISLPKIEGLVSGKYNSFHGYPHLEARLRQTVTPEEAALVLESLSRSKDLEDHERVILFDALAEHFQSIVEFPPEATEMIGSEQYIRNVVDVIYRPGKG